MLRTKNTIGNKLSMRSKLFTSVTMAILFAFLSFFSFNILSTSSSAGSMGNKMHVVKTTVLNSTNIRWDYLMDQQIVGIKVETAGRKKAMCLENMSVSLVGNASFMMKNMQYAYVCYTEDNIEFDMESAICEKMDIAGKEEFMLEFKKVKLKEGTNYLWIVVEPAPGTIANPQDIVVGCDNITLSKMKFKPIIIPKRVVKKKVDPAVDFTF